MCIVIALCISLSSAAFAGVIGDYTITSEAAIIIDFDTGLVIYEHNADELRVPASMVKMIAVHVVFDAIRDGHITLDTLVEVSESTSEFSFNRAFSNVPLHLDSSYSIRELLDVVIVRSASAATIALGEALFGSEEALIRRMNQKALEHGIPAEFHDSWGGSPENRISARGMAEMTRLLIVEHPEVLDFTSQVYVVFEEIEYVNTNALLVDYEGVDGFKTGFTNPAGWCFSGTATLNGRRIITITMGSVRGYRFPDTVTLLDYGFDNYGAAFANYFRNTIRPIDFDIPVKNALMPISMFDIEMAQHFDIREIAIFLNEN
ncbi:MAG: D-alanyl-D-alanine carboxypeptidase [Oscillospiraceae bacterium]|nr:D-alanyl-D-alanine carboxypeptidase [Oscillospiraceae bacterium]